MPGFTRTNGNVVATSVYGLSPRYFKIDAGDTVFSLDTANASYYGKTLSKFENAMFAISSVASVITVGSPAEGGNAWVVQIDNSFDGRGTANAITTLHDVVANAVPTANAIVVTESAGFVGGGFSSFTTTSPAPYFNV